MWRAASGSSFSFSWTCKAEGHGVRIARRIAPQRIARKNCAAAGRTLPIDMCALAMIDESTVAWPLVCSFW